MTNERASQYLMEVTLGDAGVLTAALAEDVFEEAQRRAAEKVARQKDEEYSSKIADLEAKASDSSRLVSELQERLTTTSLEAGARALEAEHLGKKAEHLEGEVLKQSGAI